MSNLALAHNRKKQLTTRHWPLERMMADSVEFIRKHEPPEGYFVGFSGGKDSVVVLELVRMAGVKHAAYYSCTGIDPPELVKFIKRHYSEVIWLRPKYSFWDGIVKKFPPFYMSRWCCDVLKKNPSRPIKLKHRIMGVRAEESSARRKRGIVSKLWSWTIYRPIFHWLEWHVWEFIEQYNLPYCSLYDEGFDRLGCVVCPFCTVRQHARNRERWPGYYKAFEHACRRWWDAKQWDEKGMEWKQKYGIESFEDYLHWWYRGG